jgi:alpha-1,3-rhamnosyl/mannosyltransferase
LVLFTPFNWGVDLKQETTHSTAATRLRRGIFRAVPRPRQAARLLETALFAMNARARGVKLYHEPAAFPLPFSGPTVLTVHDLSWIRFPDTHPMDRRRTLERGFPDSLRRADHVLTDSHFVKSELVSEFGLEPAKITTAPLAARDCFHPRERDECEPLLDRVGLRYRSFFLSVGTLEPRKNLVRTIRAYAGLPAALRQNTR